MLASMIDVTNTESPSSYCSSPIFLVGTRCHKNLTQYLRRNLCLMRQTRNGPQDFEPLPMICWLRLGLENTHWMNLISLDFRYNQRSPAPFLSTYCLRWQTWHLSLPSNWRKGLFGPVANGVDIDGLGTTSCSVLFICSTQGGQGHCWSRRILHVEILNEHGCLFLAWPAPNFLASPSPYVFIRYKIWTVPHLWRRIFLEGRPAPSSEILSKLLKLCDIEKELEGYARRAVHYSLWLKLIWSFSWRRHYTLEDRYY